MFYSTPLNPGDLSRRDHLNMSSVSSPTFSSISNYDHRVLSPSCQNLPPCHQSHPITYSPTRQDPLSKHTPSGTMSSPTRAYSPSGSYTPLSSRKVIQSQDQSKSCAWQTTQKQLEQLSEKASVSSMQLTKLKEENGRLNSLVQSLTTKVGHLDASEQELLTVIRLKDRDLEDASDHLTELTSKFKQLELSNKESRHTAASWRKEIADWKNRYKEMKKEAESFKSDFDKLSSVNLEQIVELGKAQETLKALEGELELSVEREARKDQVIHLQHSKQERIDAELTSLRQAYARQHRDMSILQLNMESQREKSRDENKGNKNPAMTYSPLSTAPTSPQTSKTVSPVKMEGVSPFSTPRKTETEPEQGETESVCSEEQCQQGKEEGAFSDLSKDEEQEEECVDGGEGDASPTTKLHKLLSESRQMVANLEQSFLPPYAENSNGLSGRNEESESIQFCAFDVAFSVDSLLESVGNSKSGEERFMDALDCLSRKYINKLEDGVEMCKQQMMGVVNQVQSLLDMKKVVSAGPFLYAFVPDGTPDSKFFSRPNCLMMLGRFLLEAYIKLYNRRRARNLPLVVTAPFDADDGTSLVAGIPPLPELEQASRNFFGKAFEQAAGKTGSRTLHDHFEPSVVVLKTEDQSKFFDALISLLQ